MALQALILFLGFVDNNL